MCWRFGFAPIAAPSRTDRGLEKEKNKGFLSPFVSSLFLSLCLCSLVFRGFINKCLQMSAVCILRPFCENVVSRGTFMALSGVTLVLYACKTKEESKRSFSLVQYFMVRCISCCSHFHRGLERDEKGRVG